MKMIVETNYVQLITPMINFIIQFKNIMSSFQKLEINEVKKTLLEISGGILEQISSKIDETKKVDPNFSDLDLSEIKIGKFFPDINSLLSKYAHLELLYLVDCCLNSVEGICLPNLIGIDLSKNQIGDNSQIEALVSCKKLEQIIMVDNKIQKLQTILKLSSLDKLYEIDFSKNLVCNNKDAIRIVFEKFQNISFVNGKDVHGNQAPLQNEQDYEQSENSYEEDYQDQEDDQLNDNEDSSQNEEGEEKQKKSRKKK